MRCFESHLSQIRLCIHRGIISKIKANLKKPVSKIKSSKINKQRYEVAYYGGIQPLSFKPGQLPLALGAPGWLSQLSVQLLLSYELLGL